MKPLNKNQKITITTFLIVTIVFLAYLSFLILNIIMNIRALSEDGEPIKTTIVSSILNIVMLIFFYCSFLWLAIYSFKQNFYKKNNCDTAIDTEMSPVNIIVFRIITTLLTILLLCNIGYFIWSFVISIAPLFKTAFGVAISVSLINISYILSLALIFSFYLWLAKAIFKISFFTKKADNSNS